jgi:hypothetical protein
MHFSPAPFHRWGLSQQPCTPIECLLVVASLTRCHREFRHQILKASVRRVNPAFKASPASTVTSSGMSTQRSLEEEDMYGERPALRPAVPAGPGPIYEQLPGQGANGDAVGGDASLLQRVTDWNQGATVQGVPMTPNSPFGQEGTFFKPPSS